LEVASFGEPGQLSYVILSSLSPLFFTQYTHTITLSILSPEHYGPN